MEKKYLYFQPEYVDKFKCDGSKCNARCCKGWMIDIDEATYKKYPPEATKHIKFNSEAKKYVVTLDEKNFCPMLTEDNLCRLQRDFGEDFLSMTCTSYPRHTRDFGKFFERSLTPTCPVAAELMLFQEEPMTFKFVEVPEKIHSNGGKIQLEKVFVPERIVPILFEIQLTMISILQARRFSIDQRLIILGLFFDRLQELISSKADREGFLNVFAAYQSEEFLMTEVSPLLQSFEGNAENFIVLIMKFIGQALPFLKQKDTKNFVGTFGEVFGIEIDEKGTVSALPIVAKYEDLADARKIFLEKYSTFLENYLVNELFMNCYPWRFSDENMTKNYAVFLISYKSFELMMFAATQKNLTSKKDLLELVDWFALKIDHNKDLHNKFFELLKGIDDIFLLMTCLLRG